MRRTQPRNLPCPLNKQLSCHSMALVFKLNCTHQCLGHMENDLKTENISLLHCSEG
uniref:Uncharacterized protein n=1 Tax=Anguilla anguilla TaxID=7936 RepID=A0A0E9QU10_ANGAN